MDRKRFGLVMVVVAGGLLALALYAQNANRDAAGNNEASTAPETAANAAVGVANEAAGDSESSSVAPSVTPEMSAATTPAEPTLSATVPSPSPAVSPATGGKPAWSIVSDEDENGKSRPTRKVTIGSLDPADAYAMQVTFMTDGASIYTAKLTNYYTTVADLHAARAVERAGGSHAEYLARVETEPDLLGHYSLLNPVARNGDATTAARLDNVYGTADQPHSFSDSLYLPLATRSVRLEYKDGRDPLTFDIEKRHWKFQPPTRHDDGRWDIVFTLVLERTLPGGPKEPYLELVKTYTLLPGAKPGEIQYDQRPFSVRVALTARNHSDDVYSVAVDQAGVTGVPREDIQRDLRRLAWTRMEQGGKPVTQRRPVEEKDLADTLGASTDPQPLVWTAQTNKFFAGVLYLMPKGGDKDVAEGVLVPGRSASWSQRRVNETRDSKTFVTGVKLEMAPAVGGEDSLEMDLFVGPKRTELFNNTPMYTALNYSGTIEVGQCCLAWCTFDWLSKFIMAFLEWLARHVTGGNFGVAIIVLVVIVRVLLHPLTKRGQIAMSKMAKLAPKMKELQEKYKNDKDTLNREMLKHSKEQAGVFMGCLPMLLQLPIWMALYGGLQADAELRHAAFLPVWITDLAGPDAIIRFDRAVQVPLVGAVASLNLLPLLLTVAMYLQTKLTPTPSAPATTPEQEMQQKMQKRMMQIMMPVMMLLFFYNAPSGLNLYIMTSTFSSVFEQMIIRKHIRERDAKAAATATEVIVPTKTPRDKRAKKPKGPFWFRKS